MAAALVADDPYANVRKRATSQLYADPTTIDGPEAAPKVGSPEFKDPVVLGNPSDAPPAVGAGGSPSRWAVPQNYAQQDYQPDQPPVSTAPTVARTTQEPPPIALDTHGVDPRTFPDGGTQQQQQEWSDEAKRTAASYDQVNGFYQKYLGRAASSDEAKNWMNGTYGASDPAGMEKQISESGEAQAYAAAHGGASAGGGDLHARIDAALRAAGSTDDPNYWYQKIGGDPNGGGSAWAYWLDRINRGDGSKMGLPRFDDSGGGSAAPPQRGAAPPSTYTPPSTGPTAPTGTTPFQDEIRKQIMERLKTAGMPVDENSAGITSAVSSARDEATRAGEQERTALAERLYAQGGGGLNTNALTQQIQQSGEKTAASTGGIRATLIMQEYSRKQNELDQLLSMATASGDAESARQIQLYQAELQAQLQREGISADLAKYAAYLNQNAALSGLRG